MAPWRTEGPILEKAAFTLKTRFSLLDPGPEAKVVL